MAVGVQAMKFADHRAECAAGSLNDIEVLKQHDAIAGDIEDSAAHTLASCGWNQRAEKRLKEIELNRVASGDTGIE